jgi:hypothetical protein
VLISGLDQAVVTPRKRPSALALSYTIITNNNNNNNKIELCNLTYQILNLLYKNQLFESYKFQGY